MVTTKWNSRGRVVDAAVVTPHDTNDNKWDGLWIGTAGDLAVLCRDSASSVVIPDVPAGPFPCSVRKVLSTGTTASGITGLIIQD